MFAYARLGSFIASFSRKPQNQNGADDEALTSGLLENRNKRSRFCYAIGAYFTRTARSSCLRLKHRNIVARSRI